MKRRVSLAIAVIAVIASSLIVLGSYWQIGTQYDKQASIVVPTDYSTIKEAVAKAVDGDIIFVKSGTYQESEITINKDISIIGEDRETTIITSQSSKALLFVNQSQVTITGFTIKLGNPPRPFSATIHAEQPLDYSLTAVKIQLSEGCNVSYNKIINSGRAIWLDSSSNNVVEANILNDNYYGVDVTSSSYPDGREPWVDAMNTEPSSNNTFRTNEISNSVFGISIRERVSNNVVCANSITNTSIALDFTGSTHNFVVGNYIADNEDATYFLGGSYNVFHHNNFIDNSRDINVVKNQFVHISPNIWDDGKEGNYWNAHFGSPYQLDDLNRDNCPLSAMVDINKYVSYSSTTAPYPIPTYPPAPTPR